MGAQDRPEAAETEARWCRWPVRKEGSALDLVGLQKATVAFPGCKPRRAPA